MSINEKQIEAVLSLNSEERYRHFIKRIADCEEVWGLYDEGWAMSMTDDGKSVLPFWPAKEYALKCVTEEWETVQPKSIPLDEFMNVLLPEIKSDEILLGIFPNLKGENIVSETEDLIENINLELENY